MDIFAGIVAALADQLVEKRHERMADSGEVALDLVDIEFFKNAGLGDLLARIGGNDAKFSLGERYSGFEIEPCLIDGTLRMRSRIPR